MTDSGECAAANVYRNLPHKYGQIKKSFTFHLPSHRFCGRITFGWIGVFRSPRSVASSRQVFLATGVVTGGVVQSKYARGARSSEHIATYRLGRHCGRYKRLCSGTATSSSLSCWPLTGLVQRPNQNRQARPTTSSLLIFLQAHFDPAGPTTVTHFADRSYLHRLWRIAPTIGLTKLGMTRSLIN